MAYQQKYRFIQTLWKNITTTPNDHRIVDGTKVKDYLPLNSSIICCENVADAEVKMLVNSYTRRLIYGNICTGIYTQSK